MYDKVKKCLESMGYVFIECDGANLSTGTKLTKGFWVYKPYQKNVYIEIYANGDIAIWSYKDGILIYDIPKMTDYVMMFHLACALNN